MNQEQIYMAVKVATDLCRQFEGLVLKPYLCPAGVPTIGIGSTFYADGRKVTMQDPPITQWQAQELFAATIHSTYLPGVMKVCPNVQTPNRLGALISFAYNLGVAALGSSTMAKRVNAGMWYEAASECKKWTHAGGVVLPGLIKRREAEAALLLNG